MSRQAYYQSQARVEKADFETSALLAEIRRIRQKLPGIGVEKLHFLLQEGGVYTKWGLKMGRDKLAKLLGKHGLLAQRKRAGRRTTYSMHRFHRYSNLAKNIAVERRDQVWVSDITYVPVGNGFCYLSMVTDAHSRKIVGWSLWPTLEAKGCVNALKMALKGRKNQHSKLVHHSDRGIQYCCNEYVRLLQENRLAISMTDHGDPYENALAERMNRTVKEEMLQNRAFLTFQAAETAIHQAIENYNEERPHASLNFQKPSEVHRKNSQNLNKRWKKRAFKPFETTTTNHNADAVGVQHHAVIEAFF